jgi:hypothetical protein
VIWLVRILGLAALVCGPYLAYQGWQRYDSLDTSRETRAYLEADSSRDTDDLLAEKARRQGGGKWMMILAVPLCVAGLPALLYSSEAIAPLIVGGVCGGLAGFAGGFAFNTIVGFLMGLLKLSLSAAWKFATSSETVSLSIATGLLFGTGCAVIGEVIGYTKHRKGA